MSRRPPIYTRTVTLFPYATLFRSDPGLIGVTQCAALGAVLVIYFADPAAGVWLLPAAGMAGALAAAVLMQSLAGRDGGVLTVILAGVAVGSLAWALTALAMNLSPNPWAIREEIGRAHV